MRQDLAKMLASRTLPPYSIAHADNMVIAEGTRYVKGRQSREKHDRKLMFPIELATVMRFSKHLNSNLTHVNFK